MGKQYQYSMQTGGFELWTTTPEGKRLSNKDPVIDLTKLITRRTDAGFSLIEVLLVLSLVAVLPGIVTGNAGAFIKGANNEPPNRV